MELASVEGALSAELMTRADPHSFDWHPVWMRRQVQPPFSPKGAQVDGTRGESENVAQD